MVLNCLMYGINIVDFVDERMDYDQIFSDFIECSKEEDFVKEECLYKDGLSSNKDAIPAEWIIAWCSKDESSYLIANEMMAARIKKMDIDERNVYKKRLVVFYKMMIENNK